MLIKGNVKKIFESDRVFLLESEEKEYLIHMTIKDLRVYKPYLETYPYAEVELGEKKDRYVEKKLEETYELDSFQLIKKVDGKHSQTFFSQVKIKRQIKDFINNLGYKMFLDLEFSWPVPYLRMPTEIVQYGYLIVDENDNVIEEKSSLVKPIRKSALNKKTLKFLNRTEKDFLDAENYITFYQDLIRIINTYDVKIIAWGKNDLIAMEQSFRLNHLAPLDVKSRFINIMQILKNYYQLHTEIGLFETYEKLTEAKYHEQTHDALEDAYLAKEIYLIFKDKINKE